MVRLACPPRQAAQLASSFSKLCQDYLGQPPAPPAHPRAVDLVWRLSGGRLGNALAGCRTTVLEAAARGVYRLDIGTVATRLIGKVGAA
jgi:hypothetical protein